MERIEKKQEELRYAQFFLEHFDRGRRCDYTAIPNKDEAIHNHEVDVYAESDVCKKLKLQVKIIDKDYMPGFIKRREEAEHSLDGRSSIQVRDLKPVKWAKQKIAECIKKYEPNVRKEMVLLLCVYHGGKMNQLYAEQEFAEYQSSDFKGIYLIDPPQSNRGHPGQLTIIKAVS